MALNQCFIVGWKHFQYCTKIQVDHGVFRFGQTWKLRNSRLQIHWFWHSNISFLNLALCDSSRAMLYDWRKMFLVFQLVSTWSWSFVLPACISRIWFSKWSQLEQKKFQGDLNFLSLHDELIHSLGGTPMHWRNAPCIVRIQEADLSLRENQNDASAVPENKLKANLS